jgi:hypothetical protein
MLSTDTRKTRGLLKLLAQAGVPQLFLPTAPLARSSFFCFCFSILAFFSPNSMAKIVLIFLKLVVVNVALCMQVLSVPATATTDRVCAKKSSINPIPIAVGAAAACVVLLVAVVTLMVHLRRRADKPTSGELGGCVF